MPFKLGHARIRLTKRNVIQANRINETYPIGFKIKECFFDNGNEELLTCCDIVDSLSIHDPVFVKLTIDKMFLKKIVKSHIHCLQSIMSENAY